MVEGVGGGKVVERGRGREGGREEEEERRDILSDDLRGRPREV